MTALLINTSIESNRYETPQANLVEGMRWLQSIFVTRFNRFRNERGHVFQGRYKSLLVNEDHPLLGLINYIHLNPVRAKLCTVDDLKGYSLKSSEEKADGILACTY